MLPAMDTADGKVVELRAARGSGSQDPTLKAHAAKP
jgi:hypothetical protein